MKTNRPDIAKAAGMFTGAVVCFFAVKFIILFFAVLTLVMLFIKNI